MFLKYMNKGIQLVRTIDWKKEVKQGEVFEAFDNDAESWLRNYKWMFEKVEEKEEVKEEKTEKKSDWKKAKKK